MSATGIAISGIGLVKGSFDKLSSADVSNNEVQEDPEVIAARLEQEQRRKEKHRKMEAEREKMRQNIRDKYNIKRKDENALEVVEGRIMGVRKTPEQVAAEHYNAQQQEDGILQQLGLADSLEKARAAVGTAYESVRGMFTFGPFGSK